MPCRGVAPTAAPTVGRRRSASMRITRLPACTSDQAKLMAVVVLPSDGPDPVTRTEWALNSAARVAARLARSVR